MVRRSLLFLLLLPASYGAVLAVLTFLPMRLHRATDPEHDGLSRFREAEARRRVDILILGSSHAYRSFDTRSFRATGLEAFNLGSSSQSPLNSYFLLKRYLRNMDPKVVVLTVCHDVLRSGDGLESFLNVSSSSPFASEVHFEMALATRNLYAFNHLALLAASRLRKPLRLADPAPPPDEVYVAGGYVETARAMPEGPRLREARRFETATVQWEYLERIIDLVRSQGRRLMLVGVPITDEDRGRVANYGQLSARFTELAERRGVAYRDFNGMLRLDSRLMFMDDHHLNAAGVAVFNRAFLDTLGSLGLREAALAGRRAPD